LEHEFAEKLLGIADQSAEKLLTHLLINTAVLSDSFLKKPGGLSGVNSVMVLAPH